MDLETIKQIGTTLGTIIASLFFAYLTFKNKLNEYNLDKKENLPQKIVKQADIDSRIINKMEQTKEILNADRILVYEFHNGMHYSNGRSALKMSVSYEVIRYGNTRLQQTLQGIPLSLLPNLISKILESDTFIIPNIDDFKNIQPEYSICSKSLKMKSFYNVVLKNENEEAVGFISVHFKNPTELKKENQMEITKLSWYISEELNKLL